MDFDDFIIECSGALAVGDTIRFTEKVWPPRSKTGRFEKPRKQPIGLRTVVAEVEKLGRSNAKLYVLRSSGFERLEAGSSIRRSLRALYALPLMRRAWADEVSRVEGLYDKYCTDAKTAEVQLALF